VSVREGGVCDVGECMQVICEIQLYVGRVNKAGRLVQCIYGDKC